MPFYGTEMKTYCLYMKVVLNFLRNTWFIQYSYQGITLETKHFSVTSLIMSLVLFVFMNGSCYETCCRKLHSEELHNLYSSPDIRQVKSKRMRWAGHVARMGEERKVQGFGGKARRKETTWKTKA
jgi:hypothetical protein